MVVLVLFEVLLLLVPCWCMLHEDRLVRFENRLFGVLYRYRVQRAARVVEAAGWRCFPKKR